MKKFKRSIKASIIGAVFLSSAAFAYSDTNIDGIHRVICDSNPKLTITETLAPREEMKPFVCFAKNIGNVPTHMGIKSINFVYPYAEIGDMAVFPNTSIYYPKDSYTLPTTSIRKVVFKENDSSMIDIVCMYINVP